MQTFVPCQTFAECARVLDDRRLGKQRVETLQILNALAGVTDGWRNHPAVRMWRGRHVALAIYGVAVCREWISRGFRDTMLDRILPYCGHVNSYTHVPFPDWWSGPIHRSHRSNLLRKMPEHYRQFGWRVRPDLPYVWPEVAS